MTGQRAKAYWLAHVTMALTRDHDYLGGSMVTMQDTLTELLEAAEDEPSRPRIEMRRANKRETLGFLPRQRVHAITLTTVARRRT